MQTWLSEGELMEETADDSVEPSSHGAHEASKRRPADPVSCTARKQGAEETTHESEANYRTLFETLIEGFCTVEMIFDADGKPVDYRFLEINPAFEKKTGLHNAQGKCMRALAPQHEAHWFEIYGKVAMTGEPAHFENEAKALGRYYDVRAWRIGETGSRKIGILFDDITDRKVAQLRV
jgi:PAS domain-containing protein